MNNLYVVLETIEVEYESSVTKLAGVFDSKVLVDNLIKDKYHDLKLLPKDEFEEYEDYRSDKLLPTENYRAIYEDDFDTTTVLIEVYNIRDTDINEVLYTDLGNIRDRDV